jgi:hypothetical protein
MREPRELPFVVLAAVGGALGGVAFFTFVGGAIVVGRFRGAGLSGTEAVALVPRSDLLAVGAQSMLIPTLIAVALLVPFVAIARDRACRRSFLIAMSVLGFAVATALVAHNCLWTLLIAAVPLALLPLRVFRGFILLTLTVVVVVVAPGVGSASDERVALAALALTAFAGGFAVDELAKGAEVSPGLVPKRELLVKTDAAAEVSHTRAPAAALLFLVAAALAAITQYGMGYENPRVRPAAVLRTDHRSGLCGIFVGESAERVWIGEVVPDAAHSSIGMRDAAPILALPRDEIGDMAVGPNAHFAHVTERDAELWEQLLSYNGAENARRPASCWP